MGHTVIDLTTSTSTSLNEKNEPNADDHFQWDSIKKFIYLAHVFSSSITNFDVFSKVLHEHARLLDFVFLEATIGMTYMFMDFFIKQYTRRLDLNSSLNPLLRGISVGLLLQTSVWTLIHATNLADTTHYLFASMIEPPSWSKCYNIGINTTCIKTRDVIMSCRANQILNLNTTSVHLNYVKNFMTVDRANMTSRFFVMGVVWIINFFMATIQGTTMIRICRAVFIWILASTLLVFIFIFFTRDSYYTSMAVLKFFDVTEYVNRPYHSATDRVANAFGIGFIGIYDFGTISPFMMIDNAIVIFTVLLTAFSFARSVVIQILYFAIQDCVKIGVAISPHYLLFVILPLATEFMDAHMIYALYIYLNLTTTTSTYIAMLTLSMSRLLHSEFRSVKNVYIIGILCFLGFGLSLPITVLRGNRMMGLMFGINLTALYLGGFKTALVMWVYGVEKFCTDIHFWLGFRPTKYWRICWMLLPAALFFDALTKAQTLIYWDDSQQRLTAVVWISFTLATVVIFHIRTIASYILQNNLAAAFRSTAKFGPPEPEDRKKRRKFDVTLNCRQCKHACLIMDEKFDCNHLPLIFKQKETLSSSSSDTDSVVMHIYEAETSRRRATSVMAIPSNYD